MVARVRLATAKKSGANARSISPASAITICSLRPGCGNGRGVDGVLEATGARLT
jgi:hypothetical protein